MKERLPAELLIRAYSCGIFPMAVPPDGRVEWFCPGMRGVIPLGVSRRWPHGVRRDLKRRAWEVRCDTAFNEVMKGCAAREETWINDVIFESYANLHRLGFAHSVEVWLDGELAGGLYGVHIGAAFFGESMFTKVSGASKVALVWLIENLEKAGFLLLDTQWQTKHLEGFGCVEVPRERYMRMLKRALRMEVNFPWPVGS